MASHSFGPLDDLIPVAAAAWGGGDYSCVNGNGECARYLKVVAVGAAPSLVLNLKNGETRTYTAANAGVAADWATDHGLQIASIDTTTADITSVLVGW